LLALSQIASERFLEAALNEQGVHVERDVKLLHCANAGDHVLTELKQGPDGEAQTIQFPWLLAADGAHSVARRDLEVEFEGSTLDKPWYLVDVPLDTSLDEACAHVFFLNGGGFLFFLRVIADANVSAGPLWRVMSDDPDPLARFDLGKATGPAVWESSFHVSHRLNEQMNVGQVYFAGDAAHIHSPIGARGMNLGIEDAWVFAQLHKAGQLARYGELRHKTDHRVVRRIEVLSRLAIGESAAARVLRSTALPLMMKISITRGQILETVTGLDHPLPTIA
jgi:2-polyprenyl-6-methoxyphenol hydroxylase-like FAD-dependent oxidoreductase